MARQGYNEGCLAAHALDLLGDRWAILVLRELMLGPKRFGAIKAGLPGIASNVLTQRLQDLAAAGLLMRDETGYALTAAGREARPVIDALCRWGVRQPGHDPRKFISPVSLMLSLAVMYRPGDRVLTAGFDLGTERFAARAGPEGFAVRPCPEALGDMVFSGDANAMAVAFYGPQPLAAAPVGFRGDPGDGQALVDRFVLGR